MLGKGEEKRDEARTPAIPTGNFNTWKRQYLRYKLPASLAWNLNSERLTLRPGTKCAVKGARMCSGTRLLTLEVWRTGERVSEYLAGGLTGFLGSKLLSIAHRGDVLRRLQNIRRNFTTRTFDLGCRSYGINSGTVTRIWISSRYWQARPVVTIRF